MTYRWKGIWDWLALVCTYGNALKILVPHTWDIHNWQIDNSYIALCSRLDNEISSFTYKLQSAALSGKWFNASRISASLIWHSWRSVTASVSDFSSNSHVYKAISSLISSLTKADVIHSPTAMDNFLSQRLICHSLSYFTRLMTYHERIVQTITAFERMQH